MAAKEVIEKLKRLSKREREVLKLVCDGFTYEEIANALNVEISTVKSHMSRIYPKLGIDTPSRTERRRALAKVFCPALQELPPGPFPPETPAHEPVSVRVMQMVEEDEKALMVVEGKIVPTPEQLDWDDVIEIPVPPAPTPTRTLSGWLLLVGILFGALVMAGVVYLLGGFNRAVPPNTDIPPTSVMSTATTAPTLPSQTPRVEQVTVVVTMTPEPPSATPKVEPTAIVVKATLEPTRVVLASATNAPVIPTAISNPNTAPGTQLRVGDSWRQDGFEVYLTQVELNTFFGEGQVTMYWEMANRTAADLVVTSDARDITIVANNGNPFRLFDCDNPQVVWQTVLKPGERVKTFHCYRNYILFLGNYAAPDVTQLLVIIRNWGRISEATWVYAINK